MVEPRECRRFYVATRNVLCGRAASRTGHSLPIGKATYALKQLAVAIREGCPGTSLFFAQSQKLTPSWKSGIGSLSRQAAISSRMLAKEAWL